MLVLLLPSVWRPGVSVARGAPTLGTVGLQLGDVPGFTPVDASVASLADVHDQGPSQAFVTCAATDPLLSQLGGGPSAAISPYFGQGVNPFGTPVLLVASAVFGDGSATHVDTAYATLAGSAFQSCWAKTSDALNTAQGITVPLSPSTVAPLATPPIGGGAVGFTINSTISVLGTTVHETLNATVVHTGPLLALLITIGYNRPFPDSTRISVANKIAARMGPAPHPSPTVSNGAPGHAGTPPARVGAALVYDAAVGQLVLFGGFGGVEGNSLTDTWTWDGAAWHQSTPNSAAAGYIGQLGAAYDSATGQLIAVTGPPGALPTSALQTWSWSPTGWQALSPAHSPPFGAGDAATAFDPKLGEIVLLVGVWPGGLAAGDPVSTQTWAWTGHDWAQLHPATAAPPALDQQLAFEPLTGNLLREGIGGYQGFGSEVSQTWTFDGASWARQQPTTSAPPSLGAAMLTDSVTGQITRIGGQESSNTPCGVSTGQWSWSADGDWKPGSLPPGVPGRSGAAAAFDDKTGQMVMFGGCNGGGGTPTGNYLNDTVILAGPQAAPGTTGPCRYTTRSAPAVVVVFVMGLNSELPDAPAYDVRSVDYCHIASSPNSQLNTLGQTFDTIGPGSGSTTLARSIGEQGAVILPFSYRGAGFVGRDMFKAVGYDQQTPNASDVIADATLLDNELVSIRDQWPSTHIVIIGHSLGGLTAKQWWRNWDGHQAGADYHAARSWNISAVFSLDGPINGGPTENAQWTPDGNCPTGGPQKMLPCGRLAMQFAALWDDYAMRGDDTTMAQNDSGDRGIYTPIGTTGDVVMEALRGPVGVNDNGEELGVQLFAKFNTDGTVDTLLQPGALSGQGAHIWQGLDSHGVVYRDPTNIALITQAVRQAAVDTRGPQPGPIRTSSYDILTRPAPPAPRATLAQPVAHNGLVVVRGAHLGTSPGQLRILSATSTGDCSVTVWSDTAITCRVTPDSQSGYLLGQTATGLPVFAGAILLPHDAPSGTTVQIRAPRSGQTPAGEAQPVQLSVTGDNGPAAGTSVTAVIGDTPITLTTGPDGTVTVPVTGEGQARVQAAAGTSTATAELSWQPDPVTRLTASLPVTANAGSVSTVTVTATDSTGKPVTGMVLVCGITGSPAPTDRSTPCTTDAAGRVHITLRGSAGQEAVAWAATQDGRNDAATTVGWHHQSARHTRTTVIAIALACGAAIVLLLLLLARRRSTRHPAPPTTFPS